MNNVAIMIDGAYFLKRFPYVYGNVDAGDAKAVVECICSHIESHLIKLNKTHKHNNHWSLLFRSFYYDARPYEQQAQLPISKKSLDYGKTPEAAFRNALFRELRKTPNMALRLGEVRREGKGNRAWHLNPRAQNQLLSGKRNISDLSDDDFYPAFRQKGVDMRLGIDMASLCLKKQAQTIVLIAGDSDFVPAAKMARREGVRIILDPLWQNVHDSLFEHIDGLYSGVVRPGAQDQMQPEP